MYSSLERKRYIPEIGECPVGEKGREAGGALEYKDLIHIPKRMPYTTQPTFLFLTPSRSLARPARFCACTRAPRIRGGGNPPQKHHLIPIPRFNVQFGEDSARPPFRLSPNHLFGSALPLSRPIEPLLDGDVRSYNPLCHRERNRASFCGLANRYCRKTARS